MTQNKPCIHVYKTIARDGHIFYHHLRSVASYIKINHIEIQKLGNRYNVIIWILYKKHQSKAVCSQYPPQILDRLRVTLGSMFADAEDIVIFTIGWYKHIFYSVTPKMYTICIFLLPLVAVDVMGEKLPQVYELPSCFPDRNVHGANMGPIWGRQDPYGPHAASSTLLSGFYCIGSKQVLFIRKCAALRLCSWY